MRRINAAGLAIIKESEELRLKAYQDPAGVWTVGYGHTPATPATAISEALADSLLAQDVAWAETAVEIRIIGAPTSNNEFSAMVSLVFNIGVGAFAASSLLRFHRENLKAAAGDAFLLWDKMHVNGILVVSEGLLRRRQQERDLYSSP